MLRLLRTIVLLGLLLAGISSTRAFVPLGPPNEPWQIPLLGYNFGDDLGAPKNLSDEYRWNIPVLYYSFDQSFLDFFGAQGVQAVEQAIAVFNGLQPVSSYDTGLTNLPLAVRRVNYSAQAQSLLDLKSTTMEYLAEQLGLGEAERYVWCLHARQVGQGGCPNDVSYLVVQRNLAISPSPLTQVQYSEFVNGNFIGYQIVETCVAPNPIAYIAPSFPNSYDARQSPVASRVGEFGEFFNGLTRDDVAGIRFLLSSNNINREPLGVGAELVITNYAGLNLLGTSNLALLSAQALTNAPAALQTLYPDIVISSYTPAFTTVITTNVLSYYTNYPWAIAGSPATLAITTNYTTNVAYVYQYQFANVVTNSYYTSSPVTLLAESVGTAPWGVPSTNGTLVLLTNTSAQTVQLPQVGGEYYVMPTNACGILILSNVLTTVITTTNLVIAPLTNQPSTTNTTGTNGTSVAYTNYSLSHVYYYTNHQYAYVPVDCSGGTNVLLNARGVEKITFVRRDYDSLIGQFFAPATNSYVMGTVTNNTNAVLHLRRAVQSPDFLFRAEDLSSSPDIPPGIPMMPAVERNINFNTSAVQAGQFGPGTMGPPITITYNSSGVAWFNQSRFGLGQAQGTKQFLWGSFNGTTNLPIVYPNGASLTNLVNQLVIQINTTSLPNGRVNITYPATQLSGQGGSLPYTWSLAPSSPGMPPGLVLFSDGTIGGIPRVAGIYDFTVRLTDGGGRYVERSLTLTVNP